MAAQKGVGDVFSSGGSNSSKTTSSFTDVGSKQLSSTSVQKESVVVAAATSAKSFPPQLFKASVSTYVQSVASSRAEEQTSSQSLGDAAKRNVSLFTKQTTEPFSSSSSSSTSAVQSLNDCRQEGRKEKSTEPNLDKQKIAFHASGGLNPTTNTFALPRRVSFVKSQSHPPSTTMVAVTASASLRPVLYKSHSVAYGVDSTVSPSPPTSAAIYVPASHATSVTKMMSNGSRPTFTDPGNVSAAVPTRDDPQPLCASTSLLSSSLPSSTGERSSNPCLPPDMPRVPVSLGTFSAVNDGLGHQDSFGFSVEESWRQPLKRSESLCSDNLSSIGTQKQEGGSGAGHGKWRSSHRFSPRKKQPLTRTNSRTFVTSSSSSSTVPRGQKTSVRISLSNPLPGESPRGAGSPMNDLSGKAGGSSNILEGDSMVVQSTSSLPDAASPCDSSGVGADTLSKPPHPSNLSENIQKQTQATRFAFSSDRTTHLSSNADIDLPGDVFTDSDIALSDSGDVFHTPTTPTSPLFLRQSSSSRRRSYQQATGEPNAQTSSVLIEDDDDDDEEEERKGDGRRGAEGGGGEREGTDRVSMTPPTSPRPAKNRRVDMSNYDPYQVFEVQHLPCIIFTVKVMQGRNITNGWAQDLVDTPDPYIKLRLRKAPEGRQRTRTIANNVHPVWNETFTFFLGFSENNVLEVTLMEENPLMMDQEKGTIYFNVHDHMREFGKWQTEIFNFNGVSEVDVAFHMEWDQKPTLRYSLCLSESEKEFMRKRKEKVFHALKALLGDAGGPRDLDETPTIAVIGSGGGFRAMTGYSGVVKALADSGLLDCATYVCGLSGSSWYLSTLYSHERWPQMSPGDLQHELMSNIDKSLVRLLGPHSLYRYVRSVVGKRLQGQPVSFTDFFGHMVGETLLKGRMGCRLTDQREKIKDATVPMPLYTCVHVKKDVPARSFQEWVEFSPYEIGMPKYGTFMDSKYFGSKFYMGKLVKAYEEQPLHFLQGIWGSAFCILFKRLLEDNRNLDPAEMIRREMALRDDLAEHLEGPQDDDDNSSDISDDSDDDDDDETDDTDEEMVANEGERRSSHGGGGGGRRRGSLVPESFMRITSPENGSGDRDTTSDDDGGESSSDNDPPQPPPPSFLRAPHSSSSSSQGFRGSQTNPHPNSPPASPPSTPMETSSFSFPFSPSSSSSPSRPALRSPGWNCASNNSGGGGGGNPSSPTLSPTSTECAKKGVRFSHQVDQFEQRKAQQQQQQQKSGGSGGGRAPLLKRASTVRRGKSRGYWRSVLKGIFESQNFELLSTRAGRAAVIHNFMRGLNLQQTYPISPFTPLSQRVREGDEFDGNFDLHPTHIKHIYMVDAGLTFNSPYPLVLRPQRGVDVILSFDFSARDSDRTPPFKELLLAEKWAKINRLPFPPIDPGVVDREGLKELYVFRDPHDPHCPVVLHFPLINVHFRHFKKPGVPRETTEEKEFADFDLFDDPTAPFSTFNFTYTPQNFQRLSQLTEFNTLLGVERVKEVLTQVVSKKRQSSPRAPIHTRDFKLLRMKSVQERRELKKFLTRMESRGSLINSPLSSPSSGNQTSSTPPFFTPTPTTPRKSAAAAHRERNPFTFNFSSSSSSSSSKSSGESESGSSLEGRHPFFSTSSSFSRQSSRSSGGGATSPKSPRKEVSSSSSSSSSSSPRTAHVRQQLEESGGSSSAQPPRSGQGLLVSSSSSPPHVPPRPLPDTASDDDFFPRSPSSPSTLPATPTPTTTATSIPCRPLTPTPRLDLAHNEQPTSPAASDSSPQIGTSRQNSATFGSASSSQIGTSRQNSGTFGSSSSSQIGTSRQNSGTFDPLSRGTSSEFSSTTHVQQYYHTNNSSDDDGNNDDDEEEEEFHDAAEAFTRDGEGVTDPRQAKMYYEGAKERRKLFRRQSTISTLNSFTESISLDRQNSASHATSGSHASSSSSSSARIEPVSMDIADLGQFQGLAEEESSGQNIDDDDDDRKNAVDDDDDDDIDDDSEDEHWFDGDSGDGVSGQHRGSVTTLEDAGAS